MTIALITSILWVTIRAGTSLLYATVGEILTERAGILNLGVEGIMIVGAVTGFAAAFHTKQVWVGVGVAMLAGAAMASIHAFLSVSLRAEQVVSGLALTIFGTGLANYLGQRLGPNGTPLVGMVGPKFTPISLSGLAEIPVLGKSVFNQDILTYATYLLVPLLWFFLNRTRPGLHLRAVGENPQTADAMGVNVAGIRYLYTIVGGMLIALGGAHLSLAYTPGWTEGLTAGRGWIAVALVIFATWDPVRAVVGAILFGGINAVQFRMQAAGTTIPAAFLNMLPYAFTIVVLVLITWWEGIRKRVGAPAALGLPYAREEKR
ncbi:MAG: ABC transporter permease [Anaerolineales bacterium]